MTSAAIVTRPIDPAALMNKVRSPEFGAVSMFLGTVRDTNEGRSVTAIEYSAYVSMAEAEMERIVSEARERFGVGAIAVEHRVGPLALGDVSIAIAVGHRHRAPALDATRYLIEEIKSRVPIWKLEHYADGTRTWLDPTNTNTVARE